MDTGAASYLGLSPALSGDAPIVKFDTTVPGQYALGFPYRGHIPCTSTTRPDIAGLPLGTRIFESDTGKIYTVVRAGTTGSEWFKSGSFTTDGRTRFEYNIGLFDVAAGSNANHSAEMPVTSSTLVDTSLAGVNLLSVTVPAGTWAIRFGFGANYIPNFAGNRVTFNVDGKSGIYNVSRPVSTRFGGGGANVVLFLTETARVTPRFYNANTGSAVRVYSARFEGHMVGP